MSSPNSSDLESYLDTEERNQKKIRGNTARRLLRMTLEFPLPLAVGLLAVGVSTGVTLLEPRVFGWAIDEAIIPKDWERLKFFALIYFSITSVRLMAGVSQAYFFDVVGQKVTAALRMKLFSHLQGLPILTYDKNPAGRLMTRVTHDISSLNEMFSAGFMSMLCNLLLILGILSWLLYLDLKLGLIASSVFPILAGFSVYFSQKLKLAYRTSRSRLAALNAFFAENLLGMKVVHLFNRQRLHMHQFNRLNDWYAEAQTLSIRVYALFQPSITLASGVSVALVIWFGGGEVLQGNLKVGVLVTYFSFVLSLFQPLREIADKWNTFLSGIASAERVFAILDWEVEDLQEKQKPPEKVRGHIVFDHVWFAYQADEWVIQDLCLEILPGERIGIVGHTGAGKTTLISLLMRFYDPQRGKILLDGVDIRLYHPRELRRVIGVVQQDAFLFSGTIEENVTLWKTSSEPKKAKVLASLGLQGTGERWVQERGSNLSMGERQMVAFARTWLKDPQVWILDEATANLDTTTEGQLQKALEIASAGQTCLMIAHRLATVKCAERIVVMNYGKIAEVGNHSELLARDGLYARLYRYQRFADHPAPVS